MRKVFLEGLPTLESAGCKHRIKWKESINHKVKFIYDDIEDKIEIVNYDTINGYLYLKYKDEDIFKIDTNSFKKCMLGKLLNKITGKFKVEVGTDFKDNKRDLTIIDREYRDVYGKNNKKYNYKWYRYRCNECGWDEGWLLESNLLKGVGCACCTGKTVVEGINDIATTAPWMIKYFQNPDDAKIYTKSSGKKIYPICPNCGAVKSKKLTINNIYTFHSIGCSKCCDGVSYPNKLMFNLLEQLNVEFETEYCPEWIKPRKYDFYFELDNTRYIVEMDGKFHSTDLSIYGGKSAEESKEIDDYKDGKAKEHSIEVIRIDSVKSDLKYIKDNILNSKFNCLFDLSEVDWNKCEEFALSNLVKTVCEIKRDNPNMTANEIKSIIRLDGSTIRDYLKKGSKIWDWINYKPDEEKSRTSSKSGKMNGKQVEIFKDCVSLGVFENCHELARQSKELFNCQLYQGHISSVCRGERKSHKGFTFKYVDK